MFTAEMLVKMAGLSVAGYLSDAFCTFDFLVVTMSLLELLVFPPYFLTPLPYVAGSGGGGAMSALRTFRLFRVLKVRAVEREPLGHPLVDPLRETLRESHEREP